jgi:hypothetical protein
MNPRLTPGYVFWVLSRPIYFESMMMSNNYGGVDTVTPSFGLHVRSGQGVVAVGVTNKRREYTSNPSLVSLAIFLEWREFTCPEKNRIDTTPCGRHLESPYNP